MYERAGVAEYWFVEDRNLIRVFRRAGEQLEAVIERPSARGEELTTRLLPGFRMPLKALFRD